MNVLRILRYIHQREIIFPNGSINIPVSQFISPEHSCHISFTIPNQYKLLRQLILKEPQFFYFFLYGVYIQDDIKMYMYNCKVFYSTLGSFNSFNKCYLVHEKCTRFPKALNMTCDMEISFIAQACHCLEPIK